MKYYILILVVVLSACTPSKRVTAYEDHELYQGYPCVPHCQEFASGYDYAQSNQLTSLDQCQQNSDPYSTGCKAYVTEYQIEKSEDDLIRDQLSQPR